MRSKAINVFWIFSLLLIIVACKEMKNVDGIDAEKYYRDAVDMNKYEINNEIIELEQNENVIISWPYKLLVSDSNYIVTSYNNPIYIYNKKGKFIRKISRIGDGPGEFREISSLIKISNNSFGIYDPQNQRMTLFNINGMVLSSKRIKINSVGVFRDIEYFNNHFYFEIPYSRQIPYNLAVTDSNMNIVKYFFNASSKYAGYSDRMMFRGDMCYNRKNNTLYEINSFTDNTINGIKLDTWEEHRIKIEGIKFYERKKEKEKSDDYETMKKAFVTGSDISGIYCIDDLFLIDYVVYTKTSNAILFVLYDPKTKKSCIIKNLIRDFCDNEYIYSLTIPSKMTNDKYISKVFLKKIKYNFGKVLDSVR